ncbi:hypothetical protein HDK77DRAFT_478982 [Phyllosticta capitalensis]
MTFFNDSSSTSPGCISRAYSRVPNGDGPGYESKYPRRSCRWSRNRCPLVVICVCATLLLLYPIFRFSEVPDIREYRVYRYWQKGQLAKSSRIEPILGNSSNPLQLYYPPVGEDFRPHVAPYNHAPAERPRTPLLIPFTRNNDMLRQAVLGYIAAGWPREDIVIIDNGGTLDASSSNLLSRDNPFFVDYELYRKRYGVAILQTPTLLNFAQLQNYFLRLAISQGWPYFFWSHMDVGIIGDEATSPYKSFYEKVLDVLDESTAPHPNKNITWSIQLNETRATMGNWAIKFFQFDNLALVNVDAWRVIGQWDTFVPYYNTDCDAYARVLFHGYTKDDVSAGHIFDVADQISADLDELETKLFPAAQISLNATAAAAQLAQYRAEVAALQNETFITPEQAVYSPGQYILNDPDQRPNSARFQRLFNDFAAMQTKKYSTERNSWQNQQKGGKGEPWTYDPRGFQRAWWETAGYGRDLYTKKWGTLDCRLSNVKLTDEWASEYPELHPKPEPSSSSSSSSSSSVATPTESSTSPEDALQMLATTTATDVAIEMATATATAALDSQDQQTGAAGQSEQSVEYERERLRVLAEMAKIKAFEKELELAGGTHHDWAGMDDDEVDVGAVAKKDKMKRLVKHSVVVGEDGHSEVEEQQQQQQRRPALKKRWVQRASSGEWYLG